MTNREDPVMLVATTSASRHQPHQPRFNTAVVEKFTRKADKNNQVHRVKRKGLREIMMEIRRQNAVIAIAEVAVKTQKCATGREKRQLLNSLKGKALMELGIACQHLHIKLVKLYDELVAADDRNPHWSLLELQSSAAQPASVN